MNLYGYAYFSPVNLTDAYGLFATVTWGGTLDVQTGHSGNANPALVPIRTILNVQESQQSGWLETSVTLDRSNTPKNIWNAAIGNWDHPVGTNGYYYPNFLTLAVIGLEWGNKPDDGIVVLAESTNCEGTITHKVGISDWYNTSKGMGDISDRPPASDGQGTPTNFVKNHVTSTADVPRITSFPIFNYLSDQNDSGVIRIWVFHADATIHRTMGMFCGEWATDGNGTVSLSPLTFGGASAKGPKSWWYPYTTFPGK
jgi:hypothetical protein